MQFTASAVFSYMHCSCVNRTNTGDTKVCTHEYTVINFVMLWIYTCVQESWKGLSKFLDGMLGTCKEVGGALYMLYALKLILELCNIVAAVYVYVCTMY